MKKEKRTFEQMMKDIKKQEEKEDESNKPKSV